MSILVVKGMLLGLTLSFMIGPLFFSIMEASLESGLRAGLAVASGIWVSDLLFIFVVQQGLESIGHLVALPGFRFWAGMTGSFILILFGAISIWSARKPVKVQGAELAVLENKGYMGKWLRGFLINTLNPGTLIFWLGTATGIVAPNAWNQNEIAVFFGAMMGILITTDTLKIYAAKSLRKWLTPAHLRLVRQGIGMVLIIFGIVIGIKR